MTGAEWAKRKGMGEEAIQYCRSYALEAEKKMGEMLKATERAKPPGSNQHKKKEDRSLAVTDAPTLADLGITKRESADAQLLAGLPSGEFEKVMARRCSICSRPERAAIDAALVAGEPYHTIAARFNVGTTSLRRHAADHGFADVAAACAEATPPNPWTAVVQALCEDWHPEERDTGWSEEQIQALCEPRCPHCGHLLTLRAHG